mmetsp:Transcript_26968/g.65538  ORF Transcript_26968/g.65538 Transcript_26968/m.65538 type:complete len:142 (-) Transcript_26968:285-710(-)
MSGPREVLEAAVAELAGELPAVVAAVRGEESSALRRAEAHVALAYAAGALFYVFLRAQGVPTEGHPVVDELQRVQQAYAKVRRAQSAVEGGGSGGESDTERPKVDVAAAARLVVAGSGIAKPDREKRKSKSKKKKKAKNSH